jgi:hypothetical protein
MFFQFLFIEYSGSLERFWFIRTDKRVGFERLYLDIVFMDYSHI